MRSNQAERAVRLTRSPSYPRRHHGNDGHEVTTVCRDPPPTVVDEAQLREQNGDVNNRRTPKFTECRTGPGPPRHIVRFSGPKQAEPVQPVTPVPTELYANSSHVPHISRRSRVSRVSPPPAHGLGCLESALALADEQANTEPEYRTPRFLAPACAAGTPRGTRPRGPGVDIDAACPPASPLVTRPRTPLGRAASHEFLDPCGRSTRSRNGVDGFMPDRKSVV